MRAVMGEACRSDGEALDILEAALLIEVDPLDFIVRRHGLDPRMVLERAAHWAGYAYSPVVAAGPPLQPAPRLDAFGTHRFLHKRLLDRPIIYFAPRFEDVLRLRASSNEAYRRRLCMVPHAVLAADLRALYSADLMNEARQRLRRRWPGASAAFELSMPARLLFVGAIVLLVAVTALAGLTLSPLLAIPVDAVLLALSAYRLFAVLRWLGRRDSQPEVPPLDDAGLPIYTVMIPLRDEAHMVRQLHRAMAALDYPPEKLDILFVVEEGSPETVAAVEGLLGDPRFRLVRVPEADPATKPKALAYALPFARGEHLVVYDAEDIPDPGQLRLAASHFAARPDIDCLQAELTLDNGAENWLTASFAGEYSGLFGLLLPALACHRLPMPLGGSSNHFRLGALREVGAWDAFNVTEDADLGVRLARLRYRTGTLASRTHEEAPVSLSAWMPQRTRWIKGWMQTFIVHNRHPLRLLDDMGWRAFIAFELYVAGMIVSAPLYTTFLIAMLALPFTRDAALPPPMLLAIDLAVLALGYGGALALALSGLARLGRTKLLAAQMLLPAYWVLHSVAGVLAAFDLLVRPYFWAKTEHGRTRLRRTAPPDSGPPHRQPGRRQR